MKTKVLIFLSLSICGLLPAQNVKLDIMPHFLTVRADSLFLSMDISINIEDWDSQSALMLTPVLTNEDKEIRLPYIQLNGRHKQKLYLRDQVLRKKKKCAVTPTPYLVAGVASSHSSTVNYRASLPAEDWMGAATLSLNRVIVRSDGEQALRDTLIMAPQGTPSFFDALIQETAPISPSGGHSQQSGVTKIKYKGSYVSPETDEVDARNEKELNFSLEEARVMADINPQMLSLRELYNVAVSYAENKAQFYRIINISVKLYPVHPIANLNAASAAIEQGDVKSVGRFLSMAVRDSLAYRNCRGVYELMSGNTYEGIRILKAAKAEGSEDASYNLNAFFENNKRP